MCQRSFPQSSSGAIRRASGFSWNAVLAWSPASPSTWKGSAHMRRFFRFHHRNIHLASPAPKEFHGLSFSKLSKWGKVSELCQSCCFRSVVVSRPHRTDCEVMRVSLALMDRECSRTLHRRLLHQLVPLLSASCAGATRRSFLVGRNGAAVCVNCVNAVDSVSGYSGVAPTSSRLPSRETSRHCANPAPHRRAKRHFQRQGPLRSAIRPGWSLSRNSHAYCVGIWIGF
jgi:hypothetical protein